MRQILAGLVVVVAAAGCSPNAEPMSVPVVTDESIADHALLNDVLQIDYQRRNESSPAFALVPATRPPGLLRMPAGGSHGDGGSFVTNYQFGAQWLHAVVELSPQPTVTCDEADDTSSMCVRDADIESNVSGFSHVTVYFTGNVNTAPRAGDRETDEAAEFWSRTEMVPIDEARWFADLLQRASTAAANQPGGSRGEHGGP
ncbi:hypothetical protein [Actinoplanes sp. G11-F43]|uniref:hypothetical protein n=1 Tax=Actinoplanes sp. G11-F43 TaxID=3424130 RepID=UPI003D337ACF